MCHISMHHKIINWIATETTSNKRDLIDQIQSLVPHRDVSDYTEISLPVSAYLDD